MLNQFSFHRKNYAITFLLPFLFALAACVAKPEPTGQMIPVSPIPITPYQTPFPSRVQLEEPLAFETSWSYRPYETFFIRVSQNGNIKRWSEDLMGGYHHSLSGIFLQEDISLFEKDLLLIDEQQRTREVIGSQMVMMTVFGENEFSIICGNRNCSNIIRDFVWYSNIKIKNRMSDMSPFADEELLFFKIHSNQSSELAAVSWFDDLAQPFQVVLIGKRNEAQTFRHIATSRISAFEMWEIRERQKRQIQTCLEILPTIPQTDSGHDLEVIKVAFLHNDEPLLLRFDRSDPPECLVDMMALLDKTLHRQRPGTLVEIDPFG